MTQKSDFIKHGHGLSVFGGFLIGASSVFQVVNVLYTLGFSIFQEIEISSQVKLFLSLCIFLGLTATTLTFAGAYSFWKGYTRVGSYSNVIGSILALSNLAVPFLYGYEVSQIFSTGTLLGVCLIAVGVEFGVSVPHAKEVKGPILTSIEVAVVAVLSAIYGVLIIIAKVPSPTGGFTHIGDIAVFVAALLFGYKVGGLVGIIGSVAADFFVGYERWFISILAHGLEGIIPGLAKGKPFIIQILSCVIGGFLMATTYFFINIFIKGYPLALISYARDLFVQAGVSIIVSLVIVNIIKKTIPQFKQA
jgi:uncharacterized membrane protein